MFWLLLCILPLPIALMLPHRKSLEIYIAVMFFAVIAFGVFIEIEIETHPDAFMGGLAILFFYLALFTMGLGGFIKAAQLSLNDHAYINGVSCLFAYLIVINSFSFLSGLGLVKSPLAGG